MRGEASHLLAGAPDKVGEILAVGGNVIQEPIC